MAGAVTPEEKNAIVDFLNSKAKTKSKFYFNDFLPLFPDKKPREVKKILTEIGRASCRERVFRAV